MRMFALLVIGTVVLGPSVVPAQAQVEPVDCEGPAGDPEPGTPEWHARDAQNMYCAEQRHLDRAQHPIFGSPVDPPIVYDAYREPERHDGTRFRFDTTEIAGLDAEVYRPCTGTTCPDLPDGLEPFEPPYPAVLSFHGGASNKQLHWWSSQSLAEAGYLVVSYDSAGVGPTIDEAQTLMEWLFDSGEELAADFDGERVGIAGHSAGGVVVSRFGHIDDRVDAVVSWDRAQSTVQPDDIDLVTPSLFLFADYNCQQVPFCQPEPYEEPPDPHGPGNKGQDFQRLRDADVDTMQIALRAALHLDWTPSLLSGNRYAELMSVYYTRAWFDRYVRGSTEPGTARDAFARLTADAYDDSADRHNISQGFYDPAAAAAAGDPAAGNVPYAIAGMPVADRVSFYYLSKCFLTEPGGSRRVSSDDLRAQGCGRVAAAEPDVEPTSAPDPAGSPGPADPAPRPALPATGGGPFGLVLGTLWLTLAALVATRLSRRSETGS